jgi:hypothetical protein
LRFKGSQDVSPDTFEMLTEVDPQPAIPCDLRGVVDEHMCAAWIRMAAERAVRTVLAVIEPVARSLAHLRGLEMPIESAGRASKPAGRVLRLIAESPRKILDLHELTHKGRARVAMSAVKGHDCGLGQLARHLNEGSQAIRAVILQDRAASPEQMPYRANVPEAARQ